MKRILIKNGVVVCVDPQKRIIPGGSVLVEGDRIEAIGKAEELSNSSADEVIDASGQIILPGLINCHTHTAYFIMRGLGMDRMLLDWLQELVWPWLIAMDEEDAYAASMLGYIECLRSGTTCLIDNQNYPKYNKGHYDVIAQAAMDSGLRVNFACGFSDIQFVSPPDFIDTPHNIVAENRRMIKAWHGKGRLQVLVSPINLLYCSDEMIRGLLKVMADTGVGMHTHVAESQPEYVALKKRFGKGYIETFDDMGALNDFFHSVHSVWLSDAEIELLARKGASVVYNPTSNMLLASGIAPVTKMQAAGVNVVLGTDNPNNNNDMIEAMKYGALLQKVGTLEPLATPAKDVLEMATINGARALHMDQFVGSLEVGKRADIITVDGRCPNTAPLHDPISTLVYSANGANVTNVLVGGDLLLHNGRVTHLDERALIDQVQERSEALAARVPNK